MRSHLEDLIYLFIFVQMIECEQTPKLVHNIYNYNMLNFCNFVTF